MDYKLQLQNIADLSNNLAEFCGENISQLEENDTDTLSEKEQKCNMDYALNTIREQIKLISHICGIDNSQNIIDEINKLTKRTEEIRREIDDNTNN